MSKIKIPRRWRWTRAQLKKKEEGERRHVEEISGCGFGADERADEEEHTRLQGIRVHAARRPFASGVRRAVLQRRVPAVSHELRQVLCPGYDVDVRPPLPVILI